MEKVGVRAIRGERSSLGAGNVSGIIKTQLAVLITIPHFGSKLLQSKGAPACTNRMVYEMRRTQCVLGQGYST